MGTPKYTSLVKLRWMVPTCLSLWSLVNWSYRRLDSYRHSGSGICFEVPVTNVLFNSSLIQSLEYVARARGPGIGVIASVGVTSTSWGPLAVVMVLTKAMTSGWSANIDAVSWKSPKSTILALVSVAKWMTCRILP